MTQRDVSGLRPQKLAFGQPAQMLNQTILTNPFRKRWPLAKRPFFSPEEVSLLSFSAEALGTVGAA